MSVMSEKSTSIKNEGPEASGDAHAEDGSANSSGEDEEHGPSELGKGAAPMQKRRRVTRACDECRRKKIKCDGNQPCTHCTIYSYDCTYDQPSNRRRNPVPAYVEALEARVQRAEGLIRMIAPNLDLNDPALDIAVQHGFIPGLKSGASDPSHEDRATPNGHGPARPRANSSKEADLESMVRAVGQIELDENGNWDYHGHSSGLSFVKRMREQLGDLLGPDTGPTPFVKSRLNAGIIDSPRSNVASSPMESPSAGLLSELPPEPQARTLCQRAHAKYSVLLRVVHGPTFWRQFSRIFSAGSDHLSTDDLRFLPLLFSALALGTVTAGEPQGNYDGSIEKGFRYFRAARQMMDIADIRDLPTLQAVMLMISFLQSSANLSQCYSYIGLASRAAIRMGLHRSLPASRFSPLEAEMRKRIFWSIRKFDIYTGALIGLPQSLSDEDIDQEQPTEVDDEYITEERISPMPPGTVTMMTAFNASTKLMQILSNILRTIYPIRSPGASATKAYTVPFSKIRDIEQDLEDWKAALPPAFDPANEDPKMVRAQQALRLAYAFNQVLLYRPFLHFVAADRVAKQTDQRAYACAATYLHVCRNLVHLAEKQQSAGLLDGSMWFNMYTTFFAILSLVYFAAENPDNPTTQDLMKDALRGKNLLASISHQNLSADRCSSTLEVIFNGLPSWMREGQPNPAPKKKRKQSERAHLNGLNSQPSSRPSSIVVSNPKLQSVKVESPATVGMPAAVQAERHYMPQTALYNTAPYTPTEYSPTTQTLQQFGLQPHEQDVTDLTSMIFSASEPFSYPNQPLATFEGAAQPGIFGPSRSASRTPLAQTGHVGGDQLEAQLYAMPPFSMQGNAWNGLAGQQNNMLNNLSTGNEAYLAQPALSSNQVRWQQQQMQQQQRQQQQQGAAYPPPGQEYTDINLSELFGATDWSGPMMGNAFPH